MLTLFRALTLLDAYLMFIGTILNTRNMIIMIMLAASLHKRLASIHATMKSIFASFGSI
jgi:hypothetical protein